MSHRVSYMLLLLVASLALSQVALAAPSESQNTTGSSLEQATNTTTAASAVTSIPTTTIESITEIKNSTTTSANSSESTLTTTTSTKTITTTGRSVPNASDDELATTTRRNPTDEEMNEAKRIIHQHLSSNHGGDTRLVFNKPVLPTQMADFAPGSAEVRMATATTQFGLNFIKNMRKDSADKNYIISPLSLQNLLNMMLLGTTDNSTSQKELIRVLGYETNELAPKSAIGTDQKAQDRLKPHEAMHSVLKSILDTIHFSSSSSQHILMNTNPDQIQDQPQTSKADDKEPTLLDAHLQTSNRANELPLSGQVNFTLANLVLTNPTWVKLREDYEKNLKSYYDVAIEQFGSSNKTGQASSTPVYERVNNWVKNKTQNQIDKLVQESDIDEQNLMMVLLNAAHFKGRWLHTFNTRATHDMLFYNNGNENDAKRADFMRQKGEFGYADFGIPMPPPAEVDRIRHIDDPETAITDDAPVDSPPIIELSKEEAHRLELTSKLNCSALMLPFSLNDGQELSMVILLPYRRDGLEDMLENLDASALNEVYKALTEQQVQVELPKFSFETATDAEDVLVKMGLKALFSEAANLNRMLDDDSPGKNKAVVDKVIHKAKIVVDESGAEAAAASMATIVLRNFIRPPVPNFVADHPFMFIIRHNRSNMPLFMGRVNSL